jgi:peptidyl-prolyl cis-trans isomerase SurA
MNRRVLILICAMSLLGAAPACAAGELLDRIVATVNGHIILQSDWEEGLRYEAFVNGRSLDQLAAEDRRTALDRLIDQQLLLGQVRASEFQHASEQDLTERIQELRQQYSAAGSEQAWQAVLQRYGLTEEQLKQHIASQHDLMRLVDARLRPNVNIDVRSIESYYNQELLPQLRQSGAKEVSLAEVTPKITEVLTQRRVNQLLVAWLQDLRSGSVILSEPDSRGELQ